MRPGQLAAVDAGSQRLSHRQGASVVLARSGGHRRTREVTPTSPTTGPAPAGLFYSIADQPRPAGPGGGLVARGCSQRRNATSACLRTKIFLIYVAAEKPIWEMSVEISPAVPSGIEKIKSALGHRKNNFAASFLSLVRSVEPGRRFPVSRWAGDHFQRGCRDEAGVCCRDAVFSGMRYTP